MSELDGISPKDMAEFKREFVDTHAEIKARSALEGCIGGRKANSIRKHPGDKNASAVKKHKKHYEAVGYEKQRENAVECLGKAFILRQKEILNKEDFSMKDLLNAMAKLMPQKTESKVEHDMTFADMVKSVHLERKKYKAIDSED